MAQEASRRDCQVTRQLCRNRFAGSARVAYGPYGRPRNLKFHSPDEPRPPIRFEVPHKKYSGQAWSAAGIDGANIGT